MTPTANNNRILALEVADRLLRWWGVIVAGACLGAAAAEVALAAIQPWYESDAVVYADAEKLPREMVRTTVPDAPPELQLGVVRSAVLRRENIERVVREQFENASTAELPESLIERVAAGIEFTSNADPRKPLLTIRYRDTDPQRAARVANAVADLAVAENALIRAEKAAQVTKAVQSLSRGVEAELETVVRQIRELHARYPFQTNAQRSTNEQMMAKAETDLAAVTQALQVARDRLATLDAERGTATPVEPAADDPQTPVEAPPSGTLAELEVELAQLRRTYQDTHPKVLKVLREIDDMRRSAAAAPLPQPSAAPVATPPPFDFMQSHIRAARLETERLEAERARITAERDRYRRYLAETPRVQEELDALDMQRQRVERDFQAQQNKIDTGRTGQQIEEEGLGNPFEIVRQAYPSATPAWPNRFQFLGVGVAAGLLLAIGPLVARPLLRPVIASEAGLRALGDVPVLVSIPVIPTPAARRRERNVRIGNWGLAAIAVIAVVAVNAARIVL
jgi:uncharacterized protein involved in exopolysaccharide biosynthesis